MKEPDSEPLTYTQWLKKSWQLANPRNMLMDYTVCGRFPKWSGMQNLDAESQRAAIVWNLVSRLILWLAAWAWAIYYVIKSYDDTGYKRVVTINATNETITERNVSLPPNFTVDQLGVLPGKTDVYFPAN